MRILFILLLLLTLVGCAHSNFAWHQPALYYYDSKTLADQNRQQQEFPYLYPYTYTILDC
jgi:hypothetical protein